MSFKGNQHFTTKVKCQQRDFVCNNMAKISRNYSGKNPKCISCQNLLTKNQTSKIDNDKIENKNVSSDSDTSSDEECTMCGSHGACMYCKCYYCWYGLDCEIHK